MATLSTPTKSSFTNHHGEEWTFSFDSNSNLAFIKGSDVDWEPYPVIEGVAYGLELIKEEKAWLLQAWHSATKGVPSVGTYCGMPTEFVIGKNFSFLSDDYCPICLQRKIEFEIHHCLWKTDGGPDTSSNLLRICNSCHAIITRGSIEERLPKNQAAFHHQVMQFGFGLFRAAHSSDTNRATKKFAKRYPRVAELIRLLDQQPPEQQESTDRRLRTESRIAYQYFRDLGLGKFRWADHERLFAHLTAEPQEGIDS